MSEHKILYLSRADVEATGVSMAEIIDALESAFRELGEGRVEMPPKPGVHSQPDAFIHAMPAYIPAQQAIGVKWVSGYPDNYKRGLPYITGLLILNDAETGMPLAVMDCTWITAKRTGAATAVAARYLARPESSTVGILGCGVQGRSNLEALKVLFPIRRVVAYDVIEQARDAFVKEISDSSVWGDLEIIKAESAARSGRGLRHGRDCRADPARAPRHDQGRLAGRGCVCVTGRFRFLLGWSGDAGGRQVLHRRRAAAGALSRHRLFPAHTPNLCQRGRAGGRQKGRAPVAA